MGTGCSSERVPTQSAPSPASGLLFASGMAQLHGKDYRNIAVEKWSLSHVLCWVSSELGPTLEGGAEEDPFKLCAAEEGEGQQPYTNELCQQLLKHRISGALLVYMADVDTLRTQLQLDPSRWATRVHFLAHAIAALTQTTTIAALTQTTTRPQEQPGQQAGAPAAAPLSPVLRIQKTAAAPAGAAVSTSPSHVPKYAVISYCTAQRDFKDSLGVFVKDSLGIEAWSGQDVLPGAGGGYWAEQWQTKADDDACVLIIFVLSRAFAQSHPCMTEFIYIFGSNKVKQVLPVLYEDFCMPKWMSFNLSVINYITVTPCPARSVCECDGRCACKQDCRRLDPMLQPNTDWHSLLLEACANITKLPMARPSETSPTEQQQQQQQGGSGRLAPPAAATAPLSLEERRRALMQDISREAGMELGQLKMVGVIGSIKFYCAHTEAICRLIGQKLAALGGEYVLVTGGFHGVGETIAVAFNEAVSRQANAGGGRRLFMVLPESDPQLKGVTEVTKCPWYEKAPLEVCNGEARFADSAVGKVLRTGSSVRERESIMACLPVLLLLEGGPGATNEAKEACKAKKYVVPVGLTGGAAHTFYEEGAAEGTDIVKVTRMPEAWAALGASSSAVDPERTAQAAVDLVQHLHDEVVGKEVTRALAVKGSELNRPDKLSVLNAELSGIAPAATSIASVDENVLMERLGQYMSKFKGCYMLNGHGSKNQYKSSDAELHSTLMPVITELNEKHGRGGWCCCYGGDPYNADAPDVSHVARILHMEGVHIVAIQCQAYQDSILMPGHQDHYAHLSKGAVLFYPTTFQVDNNGLKHIEFGGKCMAADGSWMLVGWSRIMFSRQVLHNIKGHLVIGGGVITRDDCDLCLRHHVPIYYVRLEARNLPLAQRVASTGLPYYGEIDEWMSVRRVKERQWFNREQ